MTHRIALVFVSLGLLGSVAGCTSTGIAVREKVFGIAKREQLVDRVEEARDSQGEAKEQFASALDEFLAITNQQGGDLEKRYKALQKEFDRSKSRAADVSSRIGKVEGVGNSLFSEWESDNAKIGNAALRAQAEQQRAGSRTTFDSMVRVMREAEGKMAPVLAAFQDQVLFLKSNLNAAAISGLQGEASRIQGDVQRLVADMQASIDEANRFIEQMNSGMGK
jgi:chromosome segregation ATPase